MIDKPQQPSGAGFIAAGKIIDDLTGRRGLRQIWESIDDETQADIRYDWALHVTEVLDMQATVIRAQHRPAMNEEEIAALQTHGAWAKHAKHRFYNDAIAKEQHRREFDAGYKSGFAAGFGKGSGISIDYSNDQSNHQLAVKYHDLHVAAESKLMDANNRIAQLEGALTKAVARLDYQRKIRLSEQGDKALIDELIAALFPKKENGNG